MQSAKHLPVKIHLKTAQLPITDSQQELLGSRRQTNGEYGQDESERMLRQPSQASSQQDSIAGVAMGSIYDKNQLQNSQGNLKPYNDPSKSIRKIRRSPQKTLGDLSARGSSIEMT